MSELAGPILPRVKTTRFVEAARELPGMNDDNLPVTMPMAGDLVLAYGVDMGDAFVSVTPALMRERGLDRIALHAAAFDSLATVLPKLAVTRLGPVYQIEIPGDLSACAYFLSDFWDDMRRQLGARPMALFAHRNFVAFAGEGDSAAHDFLRHSIAKLPADDPHVLSAHLYYWDGKWRSDQPTPEGAASNPLIAKEFALEERIAAIDGEGRVKLPAQVRCDACEGPVEVTDKAVKLALQDVKAGSPVLRSLRPYELVVLAPAAARFAASAAGRFAVDVRCTACETPWLVGGEGHRSTLFGASFRPVQVWRPGNERE